MDEESSVFLMGSGDAASPEVAGNPGVFPHPGSAPGCGPVGEETVSVSPDEGGSSGQASVMVGPKAQPTANGTADNLWLGLRSAGMRKEQGTV